MRVSTVLHALCCLLAQQLAFVSLTCMQAAEWGWGQEQGPAQQPPPVPPRLRPEQRQAFVVANQEVEQKLQAREQQLADLQVRSALLSRWSCVLSVHRRTPFFCERLAGA